MRKIAILGLLLASAAVNTPAEAGQRRHNVYRAPAYHQHYRAVPRYRNNWAVPLVGGVIVGGLVANHYYRPQYYCERYPIIDRYGYRRWVEDCY